MIVDGTSLAAISQAVRRLQQGQLVVLPTETVYGLAADARNPAAVEKIFRRKNRPASNPLIVHVADVAQLSQWAVAIPPVAYRLAERFWPGPMTLILPKAPEVSDIITAGQATIALRIPAHPVALNLLTAFGGGLAAPSANRFTQLSPTTASHVEQALGADLLIVDGGPAQVGIESTIIDCTAEPIKILRPGMLGCEAVSACVGYAVEYHTASEIKRPGAHWLHYAPKTPLIIQSAADILALSVTDVAVKCGFVVHTPEVARQLQQACLSVYVMPSEAEGFARGFYAALHGLDMASCQQIVVETLPATQSWYAVQERLAKAAAKK